MHKNAGRFKNTLVPLQAYQAPGYSAGTINNNLLSGRFASIQGEIRKVLPRLVWGQSVVVLVVAQRK